MSTKKASLLLFFILILPISIAQGEDPFASAPEPQEYTEGNINDFMSNPQDYSAQHGFGSISCADMNSDQQATLGQDPVFQANFGDVSNTQDLDPQVFIDNYEGFSQYLSDPDVVSNNQRNSVVQAGICKGPKCPDISVNPSDFTTDQLSQALNSNGFIGLADVITTDFPDATIRNGNIITQNPDGTTNTLPLTELQSQINQGSYVSINEQGQSTVTIDGVFPPPPPDPEVEPTPEDETEETNSESSPEQSVDETPEILTEETPAELIQPTPFQPQPGQNFQVLVQNDQQFQTISDQGVITTTDGLLHINNNQIILKNGTHFVHDAEITVHLGEIIITEEITIQKNTEFTLKRKNIQYEIILPNDATPTTLSTLLKENAIVITENGITANVNKVTITALNITDEGLIPLYEVESTGENTLKQAEFTADPSSLIIHTNNGIRAGILYWAANGSVYRQTPLEADTIEIKLTPVYIKNEETTYFTIRNNTRIQFHSKKPTEQDLLTKHGITSLSGIWYTRLTNLMDHIFPAKPRVTTSLLNNLGRLTPEYATQYFGKTIGAEIGAHELDALKATELITHENITIQNRRTQNHNTVFSVTLNEILKAKVEKWDFEEIGYVNPLTNDLWVPQQADWQLIVLQQKIEDKRPLSHNQAVEELAYTKIQTVTDLTDLPKLAIDALIEQGQSYTITQIIQSTRYTKVIVEGPRPYGEEALVDYYDKPGIENIALWVHEDDWVLIVPR